MLDDDDALPQGQLVFPLVAVPDELALELGQLDLLPVQLAGDPRAPQLVEGRQCLAQVDFLHV